MLILYFIIVFGSIFMQFNNIIVLEQTKKQRQVGGMIQKEFSHILLSEGSFIYGTEPLVTVTNVRMSSDLGIAYVYVSVYTASYKEKVLTELMGNLAHLRGLLGKRISKQVRRIPFVKFFVDDTLDEVDNIDRLFTQLNAQKNAQGVSMKEAIDLKKQQDLSNKEE